MEKVALEAVKVKIQEIFDEILVTAQMEGKNIVIRIALPDDIMNRVSVPQTTFMGAGTTNLGHATSGILDKEAQDAANDILGINPQENA